MSVIQIIDRHTSNSPALGMRLLLVIISEKQRMTVIFKTETIFEGINLPMIHCLYQLLL